MKWQSNASRLHTEQHAAGVRRAGAYCNSNGQWRASHTRGQNDAPLVLPRGIQQRMHMEGAVRQRNAFTHRTTRRRHSPDKRSIAIRMTSSARRLRAKRRTVGFGARACKQQRVVHGAGNGIRDLRANQRDILPRGARAGRHKRRRYFPRAPAHPCHRKEKRPTRPRECGG